MCARIVFDPRELDPEELKKIAQNIKNPTEAWCAYMDKIPLLPVQYQHQTRMVEWGNRDKHSVNLPKTGWAKQESVEAGKWAWLHPEPIVIPCLRGQEKGVWFAVREGMQGLLVQDEQGNPHAYMLTSAASHYYQMMTKHDRMPVLVGQII